MPDILTHQDTESGERISRNRQKVLNGHRSIFDRIRRSHSYRALGPLKQAGVRLRQWRALRRRAAAF